MAKCPATLSARIQTQTGHAMHCTHTLPYLRIIFAFGVLYPFALEPCFAQTSHNTLKVSMTVVSSCAVHTQNDADSDLPQKITVSCPPAHPFLAKWAYPYEVGATAGRVDAGRFFTGTESMDLSRFASTNRRLAMLTISY